MDRARPPWAASRPATSWAGTAASRRSSPRTTRSSHCATRTSGSTWLEAPDATVLAALKSDLGARPRPGYRQPAGAEAGSLTRRAPSHRGTDRQSRSTSSARAAASPRRRSSWAPPRNARAATLELRCDGARMALNTIGTGKTDNRDRSAQPRTCRLHGDAHERERPRPGASPWSCASPSRRASRRSRFSRYAASRVSGNEITKKSTARRAKISNAWISPSPIGGTR